jgi:hypothetical protein
MAPEHSPDGMAYHLTVAARYYRLHGFVPWTDNMYANLSHGMELLFMFAYAFGRHSAAALVHWTFLIVLPLAMISYARRFGFTVPGVFAAILVFTSPVVGRDGTIAYNDVALAATIFGMFYLLEVWRAERQQNLLVCAGLLAGFAFGIKYTGGVAILWAIGTVLVSARRLRPALITAAAAAIMVYPWLARNYVYTGNPVAPFFNRVFPNPYFHVNFEKNYGEEMRSYGGVTGRELLTEPTVRGARTAGFTGPVFLLAPIALLALRYSAGRWLVAAAFVFWLPWTQNIGTRFLIPSLPFLALAIGLALANVRPAMAVLAVLHAFISWPAFTRFYTAEAAWQLDRKVPVRAALRLIPEDEFLHQAEPGYTHARLVEEMVPPNGRTFAFGSAVAESYTSRDIVVGYNSGFGVKIREMLWAPLIPELSELRVQEFRFPARMAHRLRVVQTETHNKTTWSVSELRVFSGDSELPRAPHWRLRADPNPWDVPRAFDNTGITRWNSRTPLEPGQYVEMNFGRAERIDRVIVISTRDQYEVRLSVEVAADSGPWQHAGGEILELPNHVVRAPRQSAIEELKREGITHLLVETGDFKSDDYHLRAPSWGIEFLAQRGNARLYKLN